MLFRSVLTEPKPEVWFPPASDDAGSAAGPGGVVLDARTRMVYDGRHVYVNGESFRAGGRDARLMRALADERALSRAARAALSREASMLVGDWLDHGWLRRSVE